MFSKYFKPTYFFLILCLIKKNYFLIKLFDEITSDFKLEIIACLLTYTLCQNRKTLEFSLCSNFEVFRKHFML